MDLQQKSRESLPQSKKSCQITPKHYSNDEKFDEFGHYDRRYVRDLCNSISTDAILGALGLRAGYGSWRSCPCPVHGGDNPHGFGIKGGVWRCFTHHCHEKWGSDLSGLVRAIRGGSKGDAVMFLENLLNSPVAHNTYLQQSLMDDYKMLQIPKEELRKSIEIPCPFFIKKGFSPNILKKYDVGFCSSINKEMTDRTVVPIFDDDYKYIVGCSGRSIYEKCEKCSYCHPGECPEVPSFKYIRWKHNKGLRTSYHLFNLWFAKKSIMKSGTIILVEGPCDCIKMAESGIQNVVGLFGVDLKRHQELYLQRLGVRKVVIALDPDGAGDVSSERIRKKIGDFYNVERVVLSKDPGKMSVSEIREKFSGVTNITDSWD